MRNFYIILAEIGWFWTILVAIGAIVVWLRHRRRQLEARRPGFDVQPTERQDA
jgi:hypothetical protein